MVLNSPSQTGKGDRLAVDRGDYLERSEVVRFLLTHQKTAVSKCSVILIPLFLAPLFSLFHSFHIRHMKAKGNSLDHSDIILHRKIFLRAQDKIPVAAVDQVVIRTEKPIPAVKIKPSHPLLRIRRMRIQRLNIQGNAPARGPRLQIRQIAVPYPLERISSFTARYKTKTISSFSTVYVKPQKSSPS